MDATDVATSDANSCARTARGEVWCWGLNGAGQLGDGTRTDSLVPARVSL